MKRKMQIRMAPSATLAAALAFVVFLASASVALAQQATRFLGSITAINGNTLTVKTQSGETHQVTVPSDAAIKRVEPGAHDLSSAVSITLNDLAVGDRVLVRVNANSTDNPPAADQVIAIKAADVAQKQTQEREAWQQNGVGGLVKSVDAASGTIVIASGAGAAAKTITVKTNSSTVLKRYAQDSVSFDQAQAAPISTIQPGDQLRAKGDKNADGSEITADAVVSGTFKNLSGLITAINASGSTVTIKDLATKKPYTIHVITDTQMHKLPEQMAQMLAARLKGGAGGAAQGRPEQASARSNEPGAAGNGRRAGGDPQQFLSRLPAIQLSDLQKGQAIMVVATNGTTDVNAIVLLSGVEPLLQAPAASDLLSSWSMGSGGGGDAGAGQQ
jgi:hypothetical protein